MLFYCFIGLIIGFFAINDIFKNEKVALWKVQLFTVCFMEELIFLNVLFEFQIVGE